MTGRIRHQLPPPFLLHGGNIQAIFTPRGIPLRVPDVLPGNVFGSPGRVDTQGGDGLPDVGLAESDSRDLAVAWR